LVRGVVAGTTSQDDARGGAEVRLEEMRHEEGAEEVCEEHKIFAVFCCLGAVWGWASDAGVMYKHVDFLAVLGPAGAEGADLGEVASVEFPAMYSIIRFTSGFAVNLIDGLDSSFETATCEIYSSTLPC
jgi:hypothetical protein